MLPNGAVCRYIPADRRFPDYGLHPVLRVTICGIPGMRDVVPAATGKSAAIIVRIFFFNLSYMLPRIQAKTVTKGALNNDKANRKGKVRLECAVAVLAHPEVGSIHCRVP